MVFVQKLSEELNQIAIRPKMTGLELLKAVRKDENLKETPFIMITGENAEGNVVIAVREGVNNFIAKPITKDILEFKIQKVFEK